MREDAEIEENDPFASMVINMFGQSENESISEVENLSMLIAYTYC